MKTNVRRNEQGVAHVLVIVLVAVVIAVVGFAGWRVIKNNKDKKDTSSTATTQTSTHSKTATVQANCMTKYNDKDLCAFQVAMTAKPIDKTAYKATLAVTQSGSTSTLTFAQDGKGNSQLMASGGGAQLNTVILNGATYIQTGGVWVKYASNAPTSTDPSDNLSFAASLDNTKFTKIGTEACGSLTCIKYQITDNILAGAKQYAWVDTKDHLLREWSATTAEGTTDMKLSYEPVTIAMPSPVQDYSAQGYNQ